MPFEAAQKDTETVPLNVRIVRSLFILPTLTNFTILPNNPEVPGLPFYAHGVTSFTLWRERYVQHGFDVGMQRGDGDTVLGLGLLLTLLHFLLLFLLLLLSLLLQLLSLLQLPLLLQLLRSLLQLLSLLLLHPLLLLQSLLQ